MRKFLSTYVTGHLENFLSPSTFMKGDTLKNCHHFQYWVWDLERFHGDQLKVLQKKIGFPYSKNCCMTSKKNTLQNIPNQVLILCWKIRFTINLLEYAIPTTTTSMLYLLVWISKWVVHDDNRNSTNDGGVYRHVLPHLMRCTSHTHQFNV